MKYDIKYEKTLENPRNKVSQNLHLEPLTHYKRIDFQNSLMVNNHSNENNITFIKNNQIMSYHSITPINNFSSLKKRINYSKLNMNDNELLDKKNVKIPKINYIKNKVIKPLVNKGLLYEKIKKNKTINNCLPTSFSKPNNNIINKNISKIKTKYNVKKLKKMININDFKTIENYNNNIINNYSFLLNYKINKGRNRIEKEALNTIDIYNNEYNKLNRNILKNAYKMSLTEEKSCDSYNKNKTSEYNLYRNLNNNFNCSDSQMNKKILNMKENMRKLGPNLNNIKNIKNEFNAKINNNLSISANFDKDKSYLKFPSNKYNLYNLISNNNSYFDKSNDSDKYHSIYSNKSKCMPKTKGNVVIFNSLKQNTHNRNLNESYIQNNSYINLKMKENIQEIKNNELSQNKSIINSFNKNIDEYKKVISQLIIKNKNLADNSKKLINEIQKYQKEIIRLKKENSHLIKNKDINNNSDDNNNKKKINEYKEELEKCKNEIKRLRHLLNQIRNNSNNSYNQINKHKNLINKTGKNIINNKEKNSLVLPKRKKIYKRFILCKIFKEDNPNN